MKTRRRRRHLTVAVCLAALALPALAQQGGPDLDELAKQIDAAKAAKKAAADKAASESARKEAAEAGGMAVIPAGSFMMGDGSSQHSVSLRRFALAKYDVTFDDWDACVAAGGCGGYRPDDSGWGRGSRPVINVSWDDAQAYARWFSAKTGRQYRLPTEAEWEYAARAGTTTAYYWGDDIGSGHANCDGCGSQWDNKQTAPVGSFAPNPWGLYDMAGNVVQWTEDCYSGGYDGAPSDGSARTTGDCTMRVIRGGSWSFIPRNLRSASRFRDDTGDRHFFLGFRLARTLP